MILKTAVEPSKEMQDFDPQSLPLGVEHSQKVKATPDGNDCGSKDCLYLPDSTAVFRMILHEKSYTDRDSLDEGVRISRFASLRSVLPHSSLSLSQRAKSTRKDKED